MRRISPSRMTTPVGGSSRLLPALWFLVFSVLAGVCFWHGLGGDESPVSQRQAGQPVQQVTHPPEPKTAPIQDVRVGVRTAGKNPLREQVDLDAPEPDPETWRHLVIRMTKEGGGLLHINLLRELLWIEAAGAVEGEYFFLELPEMGAVGDAFVVSIGPCPPIQPGPGNVVTGTFHHEVDPGQKILRVEFSNGAVIEGVTDNHPFYSVDRRDYVAIGDMGKGDYLKVSDGITTIAQIESRLAYPGEMLYNLETYNEHVYQVTDSGVLVHNMCPLAPRGLPFRPHWTGRTINYKKGAMSPIEHIFYRHGPRSGFSNVSRFADGTRGKDVIAMVSEAATNGTTTFKPGGKGGSIVHDFGRVIGTHMDGTPATRLQVYFNEFGEVMTAFPIK